jgi:hypothetical protein
MGFDQYHEPPDELPAQTRTFARMCASLTEEAEAIGWYEQRIAIETDREAVAVMQNAQGEEFKHFAMDLEYLLRRKPLWREIATASCSRAATSSRAERKPKRKRRGVADERRHPGFPRVGRRSALTGDRRPAMSHLLREHAPLTESDWGLIDEEARSRLKVALAARQLVDFDGPKGGRTPRPASAA